MAGFALVVAACSGSGPQSSLEPQGPVSDQLHDVWVLVLILAAIVFVLVGAALIVVLIKYRDRGDDRPEPKQTHGNNALEITWTIVPALLLVIMAVPTVRGVFELSGEPDEIGVEVDVVGHQWWWEFTYPEFVTETGEPLRTANELHIPADEDVFLRMSSADVIHSFWVPTLSGKRDVVPGRQTTLTLNAEAAAVTTDTGFGPGVIPGQCAEFCGLAHADMRFRVFVHDRAGFDDWVESQLAPAVAPAEGLAAAGWQTFQLVCAACHQATVAAEGAVETIGPLNQVVVGDRSFDAALAPNLTHVGSRSTLAAGILTNTGEHLAEWLANPPAVKPMRPEANDIPEGRILGMPNLGLSDDEIDGLVALLESWE